LYSNVTQRDRRRERFGPPQRRTGILRRYIVGKYDVPLRIAGSGESWNDSDRYKNLGCAALTPFVDRQASRM